MVTCVVTYNVWLLVSILLGSGIGQLVIGPFISIRLDKNYVSARNEVNEILTDHLPETEADNNRDVNRPNLGHSSHSGAPGQGSVTIDLKDLLINKPNEFASTSNNVQQKEDDGEKSEYVSLISDV